MNYPDQESLKEADNTHYWYKARTNLILNLLAESLGGYNKNFKILDIGCGTGIETEIYKKFGEVYAMDKDDKIAVYLKNKNVNFILADVENCELENGRYDCICGFDILEHLEKDENAVRKIYSSLKKGGYFLFTVPAFNFLFGPHDVVTGHKRRYTKKSIIRLLKNSGFTIKKISYWNSILFPFIAIIRIYQKISLLLFPAKKAQTNVQPTNKLLNSLLYEILDIENIKGFKNPLFPGLTIYGIAKK